MKSRLTWLFAFTVALATIAAAPARADAEGVAARGCPLTVKFTYHPAGILPSDFASANLVFVTRRVSGRGNKHSQIRTNPGTWAPLGASGTAATYQVRPGQSFERVFELRQGCDPGRTIRLYYYVETRNGSKREYVYQIVKPVLRGRARGKRQRMGVDLGNVAETLK